MTLIPITKKTTICIAWCGKEFCSCNPSKSIKIDMENKTKHTPAPWKVKHSESKHAFNVIGTQLGQRHKIARCPYPVSIQKDVKQKLSDVEQKEKYEAEANALLVAAAPDMLKFLQTLVSDVEIGWTEDINYYSEKANQLIKKATGDE